MGGACGTHGKYEDCIQHFSLKLWDGREYLSKADVDGKIILKWITNMI
jgi:hypothetical protein